MAAWKLGADKAQWPDSFPISFFLRSRDTVERDLLALLEELHQQRTRFDWINYSYVVLVHCSSRPIVLLNSTLKIVSKVLANRLVSHLTSFVEDCQMGLIASHSILEGVAST